MGFVLMLVTSSAMFLPTNITMTPFDSMENCLVALSEAKEEWQTINNKSRCIDLAKEAKIKKAKQALEILRESP